MGNVLRSYDDMISQATGQGMFRRAMTYVKTTTTSATTNCGSLNLCRAPNSIVTPTLGGSVTAAYYTYIRSFCSNGAVPTIGGHETLLGTLTVSGNSFSSGSSMPTKTIEGSSIQTASMFTVIVATTALTATTPVLTVTYTDQDGNTGQTATMTLPSSPTLNTGFFLNPHLANGDTGVRAVTNMSISTGSAGVLKAYGVIPQHVTASGLAACSTSLDFLQAPFPLVPFVAGDSLSFYMCSVLTGDFHFFAGAVGDN